MSLIFCALVYVFIDTKSVESLEISQNSKTNLEETTVEDSIEGIEVIEVTGINSADNVTEAPPKRIKRLDSDEAVPTPDSQKLIFLPSRTLKPPKTMERRKMVNFPPNHKMSSRISEPRPFNHMMSGQAPNGFQVPIRPTARPFHEQINNIQDAIQQSQLSTYQTMPGRAPKRPVHSGVMYIPIESSSIIPVKLAGTYRHPRNNLEFSDMFNLKDYSQLPTQQPETQDPFYNFKPGSPLEINQLATRGMKLIETTPSQTPYFRRKFRHQIASIPHYNIQSQDAANIYQNVMSSGTKYQLERNSDQGQKPFSMMLDFLPMAGDQMANQMKQVSQFQQLPGKQRIKPFQGYYQQPNYFNSMRFSQLMPHYPTNYRYQHLRPQASNVRSIGMTKPSQLVVHLNLFPKSKSLKRSTTEEIESRKNTKGQKGKSEVSGNNTTDEYLVPIPNTGNGHPENILHQSHFQSNNVTVEPSSTPYYYDDSEVDEGIVVAPSLVYQNIYRDQPTHLMLKSSSTTENPEKKFKNHKLIYQTIDRPKKLKMKSQLKHRGNQ